MKFNELGRSMVEMLGVLAIIGVLSVGVISGYSKAMTKYKLNKSIENIDWLINVTYEYMFNIKPSGGSIADDSLVPYFIKMNLVPEEMIKKMILLTCTTNLITELRYIMAIRSIRRFSVYAPKTTWTKTPVKNCVCTYYL